MAKFGATIVRGAEGAGALGTDADPNTTEPVSKFTHTTGETDGNSELFALPGPTGTTISFQLWVFEPTTARWFTLGTVTASAVAAATSLGTVPKGALVFPQITANTGVERAAIGVGQ